MGEEAGALVAPGVGPSPAVLIRVPGNRSPGAGRTRVLLLGGGGREHAIARAVTADGATLFAAMRHRNPGIARLAKETASIEETDAAAVVRQATGWRIELAIIGPEAPLAAGVSDALRAAGIPVVGPSRAAAQVELSKRFLRELIERHRIPGQIRHQIFTDGDAAARYVRDQHGPVVVKPVGLTGGKGVRVGGDHLVSGDDAAAYARSVVVDGIGGSASVIIEEKLDGEEFSLQVLTDGREVVPMPPVQDHKRAFEGDRGPNTGGMGSYSAADHLLPFLTRGEYESCLGIVQRIVSALRDDGTPYRGVLYGQFMLTADGPKVIECNARFGDPEAMNVLSIVDGPVVEAFAGAANGGLSPHAVRFAPQATVCKYLVPRGYGEKPAAGKPVIVDAAAASAAGALLYYALVDQRPDGTLLTTTSRTVGVVGTGPTLAEAEQRAEKGLTAVKGDVWARHDIGTAESLARKVRHMETVRRHADR